MLKILFFCPRWGSETIPLEKFVKKVKQANYDGLEIGLPENDLEATNLISLLETNGLKYILQHYETTNSDFIKHKQEYISRLERMATFKPYLINSHTGRDFFSYEQNMSLLEAALEISKKHSVTISHETHRSRFSFAAHITNNYLKNSWLDLTWDVSHWICVAETLLEDQEEVIKNTIPHVKHIHARIGHTQGPQLADLYDEKFSTTKERHLQLWDKVLLNHIKKGKQELGITTEFGPWPYMPTLPQHILPTTQQFQLNVEIMRILKQRIKKQLIN